MFPQVEFMLNPLNAQSINVVKHLENLDLTLDPQRNLTKNLDVLLNVNLLENPTRNLPNVDLPENPTRNLNVLPNVDLPENK